MDWASLYKKKLTGTVTVADGLLGRRRLLVPEINAVRLVWKRHRIIFMNLKNIRWQIYLLFTIKVLIKLAPVKALAVWCSGRSVRLCTEQKIPGSNPDRV
jgi:hypothetical protein